MANNLKDHLKEVADAIRAKKGTSDLINPQDFATEIEGISGSGSGEGGGSSWRYFDVTNLSDKTMAKNLLPFLVKGNNSIYFSLLIEDWTNIEAVGVDGDAMIVPVDTNTKISWNDAMISEGLTPEVMAQVGITEITKEQFYDLNA